MKAFIILDRSGSMSSRWDETLQALDIYVKGLPARTKKFLLAFDNELQFVDDVSLEGVKKAKVAPRAMTALFDAIGKMAECVKQEGKKKAQIVILTDGHENSSTSFTRSQAKDIIGGWQAKGYDVIFLGADFAEFDDAQSLGIGAGQTISFDSHKGGGAMAQTLSTRAMAYESTGVVADFTDEERATAMGAHTNSPSSGGGSGTNYDSGASGGGSATSSEDA